MRKRNIFLAAEREYKYGNSEDGFLTIKIKDFFKPSALKRRGFVPNCTKVEIKKHFFLLVHLDCYNIYNLYIQVLFPLDNVL